MSLRPAGSGVLPGLRLRLSWLSILEQTRRPNQGEATVRTIKNHCYERYVVKSDEIAENYFELQQRIAMVPAEKPCHLPAISNIKSDDGGMNEMPFRLVKLKVRIVYRE